jgi:D-beta-D-heptose 7-phosphate kinase/D-beta-D-heptose 1-phosphate adenosyltransferase
MLSSPIAVIGDVILDHYTMGSVSRISPEAPVPVLLHARDTNVAGGAANVAVNAAAMGSDVRLVGLVGADSDAGFLRRKLAEFASVDACGLVEDPTRPTVSKMRVVAGRQQLLRIDREANDHVSREVEETLISNALAAIEGSAVVILSDYAKGVLTAALMREVIRFAKAKAVPVVVDPKRQSFRFYRGATLLKPNLQELRNATGLDVGTDEQVCAAAEVASEQFGGDVLVTRSELGMTLWRRGEGALHFPTDALEVADVSGAGDTSLAALGVWLAKGYPLEEAARVANRAAAIAVSRLGTTVVSKEELALALGTTASQKDDRRLRPLPDALDIVKAWKEEGRRVVFTNGCFDLVHPGHIDLLDRAAREGNRLVVAINSDASVKRLKGPTRPVQDEQARARVIGSLRMVDLVLIFEEDTPYRLIQAVKPDVLVKGADYSEEQVVGGHFVKSYGGKVVLVPLVPNRSTSNLVLRARET